MSFGALEIIKGCTTVAVLVLLTESKVVCSVVFPGDIVNSTGPKEDGTETKDVAVLEISSLLAPISGVVNDMMVDGLGGEGVGKEIDNMEVDVTMTGDDA